jgi:hypothetical protein
MLAGGQPLILPANLCPSLKRLGLFFGNAAGCPTPNTPIAFCEGKSNLLGNQAVGKKTKYEI